MRDAAMKEFVKLAQAPGPLRDVVRASTEDDVVSSDKLQKNLEAAGMTVTFAKGKVGHFVNVTTVSEGEAAEDGVAGEPEEVLVAHGYSNTESDALKQAMYQALKDETEAEAKTAA